MILNGYMLQISRGNEVLSVLQLEDFNLLPESCASSTDASSTESRSVRTLFCISVGLRSVFLDKN